ncbi:MAG: alpha/beta fold hydrolase [Arenicellales bacterium]|nr:alpha/beta fold hydrolase [Arenicellales bacterium]
MKLYFEKSGNGEPVVLVHGLFGSSTNLRGIARKLATHFQVINVDLQNHGRSPHTSSMTYDDMSAALKNLAKVTIGAAPNWVGHSMGGKAVMNLALTDPDRVNRLVVIDIAPVSYTHGRIEFIDAMLALNLKSIRRRADADNALSEVIKDPSTRRFLLQNLVHNNGEYTWRLNLHTLRQYLADILAFPDRSGLKFDGPTLVVSGEDSNYVLNAHQGSFLRYFPKAQFEVIPGAGHWVHAEQPQAVNDVLYRFIGGSAHA